MWPLFETLIEAAGDVIYTLDLEGRFTYFNRAAQRVLGYARDALLGEPFVTSLRPRLRKPRRGTSHRHCRAWRRLRSLKSMRCIATVP
jgi:PAS domain S-box-containing protein